MVVRDDRLYADRSGRSIQSDRPVEHENIESRTQLTNRSLTLVSAEIDPENPFVEHIEMDSCAVCGKPI